MVLLGLALGCGLVASIGISQVMDRRGASEAPTGEMEPILVAAVDIHYNDELTPDKIRIEEWPKGKVPLGAITKLDEIQGRRSATKLFAGEPVLTGKLMGADGIGAARKIPQGYRVVSVKVDEVTGASSLIKIDDRVDVLAFLTRNTKDGEVRSANHPAGRAGIRGRLAVRASTRRRRQRDRGQNGLAAADAGAGRKGDAGQ